ncbi:hypothetical protein ACWEOW_19175 [Monashia sp. NPDC004114]
MVQVSVSATVSVHDGPMLPVGAELEPDSYVVSGADLDASGGADDSAEIALLPTTGNVALLAISCTSADGSLATVTVTPSNGGTDGDALTVEGSLLVANASVLTALVAGGPRTITVTNTETVPVSVQVVACLDA